MRLGIIVPFRKREAHLIQFIPHMTARFPKAFIAIIEQYDDKPFNRAKLLNVGYHYYNQHFDYFAAHDVDMLPVKADYSYPNTPTHIATQAEQFGYKMPFAEYFGGVTLFNNEDFEKVNGYSNEYFGWGAEDDDIRKRVIAAGLTIGSRPCSFKSMPHARKIDANLHAKNVALLNAGTNDGLSDLQYEVVSEHTQASYTHLKVKL